MATENTTETTTENTTENTGDDQEARETADDAAARKARSGARRLRERLHSAETERDRLAGLVAGYRRRDAETAAEQGGPRVRWRLVAAASTSTTSSTRPAASTRTASPKPSRRSRRNRAALAAPAPPVAPTKAPAAPHRQPRRGTTCSPVRPIPAAVYSPAGREDARSAPDPIAPGGHLVTGPGAGNTPLSPAR